MSFSAKAEKNMCFGRYNNGFVKLPGGNLLVSGHKISFLPNGSQTVYGYETDDEGNIIGHYINGEQVTWEGFKIKIAEKKEITGSNFGKEPIYGITSLLSREVSQFLPIGEALPGVGSNFGKEPICGKTNPFSQKKFQFLPPDLLLEEASRVTAKKREEVTGSKFDPEIIYGIENLLSRKVSFPTSPPVTTKKVEED